MQIPSRAYLSEISSNLDLESSSLDEPGTYVGLAVILIRVNDRCSMIRPHDLVLLSLDAETEAET